MTSSNDPKRTPKLIRNIPPWFKATDYDAAIRLDARGWAWEIARRVYGVSHSTLFRYPPYGLCPQPQGWCEPLPKGNHDPLTALSSVKSLRYADILRLVLAELPVKDMRRPETYDVVSEHIEAGAYEIPFDLFCLRRAMSIASSSENALSRDSLLWTLWTHINTEKHVYIDLAASDEQITSDLKQWLAEARKRLLPQSPLPVATKRGFDRGDFANWVTSGLLPCFDLQHWAKQENVRIPTHMIGRAIRPKENLDFTEAARYAKQRASAVVSERTLCALNIQITEEQKLGMKTP